MASYWSHKESLPSTTANEKANPEFVALTQLSKAQQGLTLAQGQADIFGFFEMLCALHYHYQNFLRIVGRKAKGDIEFDAPDERFEAAAYITRIGQIYYFWILRMSRSCMVVPE